MSELAIALITTVGGIIGAVLAARIGPHPRPRRSAPEKAKWFLLGAGAGLTLALIGFGVGRACCNGGPELSIGSPEMHETVPPREIEARGTWRNVSKADEPRLVIYVPELDLFYPDAEILDLDANGEWSARTLIGGGDDSEMVFHIIATTSSAEAQNAIGEYLDKGRETGDWPGMRPLPEGVTRHHSITVVRE